MQNRFPVWKNLLILIVFVIGCIYALPNLFGDDPSVQVSSTRTTKLEQEQISQIEESLKNAGIAIKLLETKEDRALIRLHSLDDQLKASDLLKAKLGNGYNIALNLAPDTPDWLRAIGAEPMYLGLDLRGGVHFLLEVDMAAAINTAEERYAGDIRAALRQKKIRYVSISKENGSVRIKLKTEKATAAALALVNDEFTTLDVIDSEQPNQFRVTISETERREIEKFALDQNITTLRNRVNEIGVAEPIIQRQGENRIVVQLPGIQDTVAAKDILGATATLEFRLADVTHDVQKAVDGHTPIGTRLYYERNGAPILLKRRIIVTGDQIVDASSGFDQNGSASVFISLNGVGAKKMGRTTLDNIGKPMAVVFLETKVETKVVNGKKVRHKETTEEVINVATIQGNFSKRFQITGLDSPQEATGFTITRRCVGCACRNR
jgi:preprotein translocase subunit SecD